MGYPHNKAWRHKNPKRRQQASRRNYSRGYSGPPKAWTPEDDKMVLARSVSDRELSFKIEHTVRAIQHRRHRLKKEEM